MIKDQDLFEETLFGISSGLCPCQMVPKAVGTYKANGTSFWNLTDLKILQRKQVPTEWSTAPSDLGLITPTVR